MGRLERLYAAVAREDSQTDEPRAEPDLELPGRSRIRSVSKKPDRDLGA